MSATQTKERPILFSAPMVQAILAGRKTQTRRIAKLNETLLRGPEHYPGVSAEAVADLVETVKAAAIKVCPYGKVGDRLWVRETFALVNPLAGCEKNARPEFDGVRYAATWTKSHSSGWKPSIHMPRWASRITLEITDVRVERLQAITAEDAIDEGVMATAETDPAKLDRGEWEQCKQTALFCFKSLWGKINGDDSWEANPWVWALTFKEVA
jgi:hypothetical protein